jgi:hypothetical protein
LILFSAFFLDFTYVVDKYIINMVENNRLVKLVVYRSKDKISSCHPSRKGLVGYRPGESLVTVLSSGNARRMASSRVGSTWWIFGEVNRGCQWECTLQDVLVFGQP